MRRGTDVSSDKASDNKSKQPSPVSATATLNALVYCFCVLHDASLDWEAGQGVCHPGALTSMTWRNPNSASFPSFIVTPSIDCCSSHHPPRRHRQTPDRRYFRAPPSDRRATALVPVAVAVAQAVCTTSNKHSTLGPNLLFVTTMPRNRLQKRFGFTIHQDSAQGASSIPL